MRWRRKIKKPDCNEAKSGNVSQGQPWHKLKSRGKMQRKINEWETKEQLCLKMN